MSASREELIKYWTLQKYLDYCFTKCRHKKICPIWSEDGASFKMELVSWCPYESMRKAFKLLRDMTSNKPVAYYAIELKQYDEIMTEVEKKLKEKVVKI
jgi:hypothetical protein